MFDFPGIYKEADKISNQTQRMYLLILRIFLSLLVISSILVMYFDNIWEMNVINAVISLVILSLSFVFFLYDFQGIWYNARAVAESIKTSCWRYAIRAEPYNIEEDDSKLLLIDTMKAIVEMNKEFKKYITAEYAADAQLPDSLWNIRMLSFEQRLDYYHLNRVVEQLEWYTNKSKSNRVDTVIYSCLLIFLSLIVSVLLFFTIDKTNQVKYPIEVLISLVSVIFTWVQTKRYKELQNSYSLAAYEIGFISSRKFKITSEHQLSDYVNNSENAFSREHTQWIARKDN